MTGITLFLIAHYVGDWRLQSTWMALNKGKWASSMEGVRAITSHVTLYTWTLAVVCAIGVLLGVLPTLNVASWVGFFLVTWGTHLAVDMTTSRMTTRFWFVKARSGMKVLDPVNAPHIQGFTTWLEFDWKKRSQFFNTIGFDQTMHFLCLFWAARLAGIL
jgi:hypothetical protein